MDADRIVAQQGKPDRLKNWLTGQFSLDTPDQDFFSAETAGDVALGLIPGTNLPTAARDFERARRNDDKLGMGLSVVSALPLGNLIGKLREPVQKIIRDVHIKSPPDSVRTVDLRRPDILEEAKNPLKISDFQGQSLGDVARENPELVDNERIQSLTEFLRQQQRSKYGGYTTKSGVDYNIKPENLEKIPRSKYGALPPTETQEFNAYTPGFRNKPDNMGGVRVTVAEGEQPYSGMSYIHRNWRGQGIASNIYDEIEKSYGKMKPSIHLSEAGQRLWAKRDPAALYKSMESELEDLPEQMHFSGDWVKEGLDRFLDKYRAPEIVPLKNDVYDETIKKLRDKGFKFSWEE